VLRAALADAIAARPRDEWLARAEGTDACIAPVLPMLDAASHPHIEARGTIVERDGVPQPAAAPRFSVTSTGPPGAPCVAGQHTDEVLSEAGFGADEVASLRASGVVT
jgi:alpha-methylacyl-CoA racemase